MITLWQLITLVACLGALALALHARVLVRGSLRAAHAEIERLARRIGQLQAECEQLRAQLRAQHGRVVPHDWHGPREDF